MKKKSVFARFCMLLAVVLLMAPAMVNGQTRSRRATVNRGKSTVVKKLALPKKPDAPSALRETDRTIKDLLFYPMACLPEDYNAPEEVRQQLTDLFGQCERINGNLGLHYSEAYDFTYRGVPIGVAFYETMDHRQWYHFYFETKGEADRFYQVLSNDVKAVGIPLTRDKIYGGLSNRLHPVSIFKWVYVSPAVLVKEADESNINGQDVVGMYMVEMGVYKKK